MIRGFTHVSLSVVDLDRSVAFYRDVLGLELFVDRFDPTRTGGSKPIGGTWAWTVSRSSCTSPEEG